MRKFQSFSQQHLSQEVKQGAFPPQKLLLKWSGKSTNPFSLSLSDGKIACMPFHVIIYSQCKL